MGVMRKKRDWKFNVSGDRSIVASSARTEAPNISGRFVGKRREE